MEGKLKTAKEGKRLKKEEKTLIKNTFILVFPSFILSIISMMPNSVYLSIVSIGLFFYQAILIQNYISAQINRQV